MEEPHGFLLLVFIRALDILMGVGRGETLVERQFAASSITDSLGSTAQGRALSMLIDTEGPDRSGVCIFLP